MFWDITSVLSIREEENNLSPSSYTYDEQYYGNVSPARMRDVQIVEYVPFHGRRLRTSESESGSEGTRSVKRNPCWS